MFLHRSIKESDLPIDDHNAVFNSDWIFVSLLTATLISNMLKLMKTALFCLLAVNVFAQVDLVNIGHIDLNTLHDQGLNDIWGYTDELGNEYALVGGEKGTSVVSLVDPVNPQEIFYEPGMESIWRDLKTVGDYAYVTTEALNGLLIIDLSPLPASSSLPVSYYNGPGGSEWASAHNLYADDNGYVYIFGSNRGNGGVIILDVTVDPMNPVEVGVFDNWYVHDGYIENDTMYLGHINDGFFSMVDVTDKANPVLLGTHDTPHTFTHNAWGKNNDYVFTTDEVSGAYIGAYDVSDPSNIVEVDRIQSSPGSGVIPHNAHVMGDYIITSYYSDGVVVHDATYPYNMIEVGSYDTYPLQTAGYDGCWGVYPYFPSGLIVASDREYGMFVLSPTYNPAAYLEGIITDSQSLLPVEGVQCEIIGSSDPDLSNVTGFYATGMANGGTYDVTYSKIGYYPQTISTTIVNGVITTQDVQLVPIPPFTLDITVLEEGTNNPLDNVEIQLVGITTTHTGLTNALGEESVTMYHEETYRLAIGKWGHVTYCEELFVDASTGSMTVHLAPSYYDDFTFDYGWSVSGDAPAGQFERAVPEGSESSPYTDAAYDCSDYCYITENLATGSISDGDVDAGYVLLTSPMMDLSTATDPYVHYERWFYMNGGILPPGDSLEIFLRNGTDVVKIDIQKYDTTTYGMWIEKNIRILDYLSLSSTMQIQVFTSDFGVDYNITEAAFDDFFIVESEFVALPEIEETNWIVFPNPGNGIVQVRNLKSDRKFEIRSLNGVLVQNGEVNSSSTIDLSNLSDGVYFLKIGDRVQKILITK